MKTALARSHDSAESRQDTFEAALSRFSGGRIEALDLARGIAIGLMILSHGVKGLLSFEQFPYWGLVPVHLLTKFSSSLFLLVFGVCLAAVFLPHVGTPRWPEKRNQLLLRGLVILFWYKVLTVVEMFHLSPRQDIIDALLYKTFPVYVEILGFYALALLWIPFALSLWKPLPFAAKLALTAITWWGAGWLYSNYDFGGNDTLKALLVEHDKHYTWGQISRAPQIFLGLLIGEALVTRNPLRLPTVPMMLAWTGASLLFVFTCMSLPRLGEALLDIALNKGKHPPEAQFMLFSMGGALLILAWALAEGKTAARALSPITLIGRQSLQAFVIHAVILFVFYRYWFGLWLKVSYAQALGLSFLMMGLTATWIKVRSWLSHT